MENEVNKSRTIAFLLGCKRQVVANVPEQKELIAAYEMVLEDLRNFDY